MKHAIVESLDARHQGQYDQVTKVIEKELAMNKQMLIAGDEGRINTDLFDLKKSIKLGPKNSLQMQV